MVRQQWQYDAHWERDEHDASDSYSLDASEILDRIAVMRRQEESDAYRRVYYFSRVDHDEQPCERGESDDGRSEGKPIDAECRRLMHDWCLQIVDFCRFSRESVTVAMQILDRFLTASMLFSHTRASSARKSRKEYQLAAMTALYTAVKLNEPVEMDAALVSELSKGVYSAAEVADMEMDILGALQWKVNGPTPLVFLGHFLPLLPRRTVPTPAEALLLDLFQRQTELAAADSALVPFKPSTIAVAVLINTLKAVDESVMSPAGKVAFLKLVRDATRIDVTGDEVQFARARLLGALEEGGERVQNEAEQRPEATPEGRREEEEEEPELACERSEQDEAPASKRRCSQTGAAGASRSSPVSVAEE